MLGKIWKQLAHAVLRKPARRDLSAPDDVTNGQPAPPSSRAVAGLPDDILTYWLKTLVADDVQGMSKAEFRFQAAKPERLGAEQFTLTASPDSQAALSQLFSQARAASRPAPAPARPADAADEGEGEDEEDEDEDGEPVVIDACMPMALVFYRGPDLLPPAVQASSPSPELTPAPLDIVFWLPFEVDEQGKALLPGEAEDAWPRVVRQWLDPQPAGDRDIPDPIAHLTTYRAALKDFMAATAGDSTFSAYVKAGLGLFETLRRDAQAHGYSRVYGHWLMVPRMPGYAVRGLANVYRSLPALRAPSALEQVLGNLGPSVAMDSAQPISAATCRRHLAMVDKAAKAGFPDADRSADPLNDSQRRALHALIDLEGKAGVIAVSGPPGTGKTAMLRAMIANRWVSAACDGGACPVIVVCGATNQSVENVMGTFDGAVADNQLLARRWLRGKGKKLLGLTASIPANKKREEHKARFAVMKQTRSGALHLQGYGASHAYAKAGHLPAAASHWAQAFRQALYAQATFNELFSEAEQSQVHEATKELTRMAHQAGQHSNKAYSEMPGAPEPVVARCRELLEGLTTILQQGLRAAAARQEQTRARLLAGGDTGPLLDDPAPLNSRWLGDLRMQLDATTDPRQRAIVIEKILDVMCRPMLFQMTARYWEARWLISLTQSTLERPDRLRQLAMLFPCMVSTLHSAPKLLSSGDAPLFGFADLLIIDEAGQAGPELGAAVLSLARQAVIVGDMKQLAPVSSVTPELDARRVADRWGGSEVYAPWQARGADAATGSVMKLAASGASRAELAPDGAMREGLLLREHYRCAESIITVCIDLLYSDHDRNPDGSIRALELVPMIPDPAPAALEDAATPFLPEADEQALRKTMKAGFPLPPLAFYQTGGPNDEPVKQDSWRNQGEVDAIVAWLGSTGKAVCRWLARADGRDGEDDMAAVIAIVTPFRAQARAIRQAVEEVLDKLEPPERTPPLSKRMTIGTVHTLQGAEKPVVLFSAVNKDSKAIRRTDDNHCQRVFIDRDDGRLLNVAVSRAQKSFILFGHADLFFSPQAMRLDNDLPSAILGRCLAGIREPEREARTRARRTPAVKLGPSRLMVVESPHKAKLMQNRLPNDVQTFGTGGHIRDLAGPGAIRHEDGLRPRWQLNKQTSERAGGADTGSLLQRTATRLLQCDELILGTDNDAQGEAIAWHLLDVLKDAPWFAHVKRVRRVRFQSLSAAALDQALRDSDVVELRGDTPEARMHSACAALNMGIAYGALATRVLDNLIGSVYARHGVRGGGRVKGPLLRALAGEGDDADAMHGRYGLSVFLGDMGETVPLPARLVASRAGGPWKPWSAHERGEAERCLRSLHGARVPVQPCLEVHDLVRFQAAERIGTAEVLREAFRRHRILPSDTMNALQGLYEQDTAPPAAPAMPHRPGAWAAVDADGVMRLSQAGREMAQRLMADPWLVRISSRQMLAQFEFALSMLALKPAADSGDYCAFVQRWAGCFDDSFPAALPVQAPGGPTIGVDGAAFCLLAQQPPAPLPSWRPVAQGRAAPEYSAGPKSDSSAGPDQSEAASAPSAAKRDQAHGALVPIDTRLGADSPHLAGYSPRQRQIYAMLRAMALASIVEDAEVRLLRQVFPLTPADAVADDDAAADANVELGVEVLRLAEVTRRGWADIDPEGWTCLMRELNSPGGLARALPACPLLLADPHIASASLGRASVDALLDWMVQSRLGRPSTFATHIAALLNGPAAAPPTTGLSSEEQP